MSDFFLIKIFHIKREPKSDFACFSNTSCFSLVVYVFPVNIFVLMGEPKWDFGCFSKTSYLFFSYYIPFAWLLFTWVFFLGRALGNPIVTDVQPRRIGYGGGAVTIHGQVWHYHLYLWFLRFSCVFLFRDFPKMFSASLTPYLETRWERIFHFHQTKFSCSRNEKLWNLAQVWFANEFVSVVCKTPISSNFLLENPQDPSTTRITCHLPPRMGSQGSDWFNLILKVVMYTVMSLLRTIAKEKNCKEISTVWQLKSSTDRVRHMFFYYWV